MLLIGDWSYLLADWLSTTIAWWRYVQHYELHYENTVTVNRCVNDSLVKLKHQTDYNTILVSSYVLCELWRNKRKRHHHGNPSYTEKLWNIWLIFVSSDNLLNFWRSWLLSKFSLWLIQCSDDVVLAFSLFNSSKRIKQTCSLSSISHYTFIWN